jgi:hypothetical protein
VADYPELTWTVACAPESFYEPAGRIIDGYPVAGRGVKPALAVDCERIAGGQNGI